MTYRTANRIRKYVNGYGFISFSKNHSQGLKNISKKIINKEMSSASRLKIKDLDKVLHKSKYGKIGNEFGKIAGKKY